MTTTRRKTGKVTEEGKQQIDAVLSEDTPVKIEKRYARFAEDVDADFDLKRAKFEYTKGRVEIDLDRERWRNRRAMAWISIVGILLATYALFFIVDEARIDSLGEVISWFYMAMASIVGTYIGTTTWAYVSTARNNKRQSGWGNYGGYGGYGGYDGGNGSSGYGGGRLDDPNLNKDEYYTEG